MSVSRHAIHYAGFFPNCRSNFTSHAGRPARQHQRLLGAVCFDSLFIEHRQRFTFVDFGFDRRHQRSQLVIVARRELRVLQCFIGYDFFKCFFGRQWM